jgi:NAD(P)-dependent dehydrogenase (short-subunit alcohol dehydrogenase family)
MATILITGANRGIGLALTQHLSARGDQVIAVCRQNSPALESTGARIESGLDVTDEAALAALVHRLAGVRLDTVFLNAGILRNESLDRLDADAFDGMREQFEVNTLGPLRVARSLLDRLGKGSKIAIITSRMGSMADNGSGGYYGYRASKAAVNAIGRSLAMDLAPRGIAVFLLHPGYVASDMTGGNGDVSTTESAAGLIARLDSLSLAETGTFWHANGQALPW